MKHPGKPVARPRIAVFGPYSSRNFGDTAIQMAVLANLTTRLPGAEFVGVCHRARDTLETHGILAYPLSGDAAEMLDAPPDQRDPNERRAGLTGKIDAIRTGIRRLRNIRRIARSFDLLLISGSGQLDDFWGGPWGQPWALLAWSAMCRLGGGRVAVLCIGLDTLSQRLSRLFAFAALRLAAHRVYRDTGTLDYLQAAGLSHPASVAPDLAFSFPRQRIPARRAAGAHPRLVMVCPISQRAFRTQPPGVYQNYLESLLTLCQEFTASGHSIRIANSQVDMDGNMVAEFAGELRRRVAPSAVIEACEVATVAQYLALAADADVVVASRMHGLILAILTGTPVVGISYTRKVRQVLRDAHCETSCIDLADVTPAALLALVRKAIDVPEDEREALEQHKAGLRAQLEREYDKIASLARQGSATDQRIIRTKASV